MRNELFQQLKKQHPRLYRELGGIACGDGWYNIIEALSEKLEKEIEKLVGENPAIAETYLPAAVQVKEKFGGLRFYMGIETDEMSNLIRRAEEKSYHTCEECGWPGQPTNDRWIKTLCRAHWPEDTIDYDELERQRELPDSSPAY
jgi:hypothetical protein